MVTLKISAQLPLLSTRPRHGWIFSSRGLSDMEFSKIYFTNKKLKIGYHLPKINFSKKAKVSFTNHTISQPPNMNFDFFQIQKSIMICFIIILLFNLVPRKKVISWPALVNMQLDKKKVNGQRWLTNILRWYRQLEKKKSKWAKVTNEYLKMMWLKIHDIGKREKKSQNTWENGIKINVKRQKHKSHETTNLMIHCLYPFPFPSYPVLLGGVDAKAMPERSSSSTMI